MKSIFKVAAPAVAVLLTGCWSSNAGLMTPNVLDKAPIQGSFTSGTHSKTAVRSKYNVTWNGKIAMAIPPGAETTPASQYRLTFDLLQKDIYLVQATDGSGVMKGYVIAKFDRLKNMKTYNPPCEQPELGMKGVTISNSTCYFTDYPTLLKSAKARAANIAAGGGETYIENQYTPTELVK